MDGMKPWGADLQAWAESMRAAGMSPLTIRLRQHHVTRLARASPGGPWDATCDTLAAFLANPTWSPATRRSVRASVSTFYAWAARTGRITSSPAAGLPQVHVPVSVPRPCPEPVLAAALGSADPPTRLMLMLAAYAGLRRAEVSAVRSSDVTPLGLRVHGKGGRVRVVPVHPRLAAPLAAVDGWAFPSPYGGHLTPDAVGRRIARALGGGWTAHSLRHRFATAAYCGTRDLRAVQELLGHSKPETTMAYTAIPADYLSAAVLAVA